ncbi:hypothetical protein CERZMDRAFT_86441 [Cercospora zeae-maydis SCOH1-5]|uniref:Uncharacterized protein n=1 Tax=Cercospora zeae-maydis SCOH1-5 TaxID=717836 RepID=A0A6A6F9W5_9PEZI|nr:hypothetical protein CERZMDRAFT_86441 [Cercospora zeae-maydis SCOH1-5]
MYNEISHQKLNSQGTFVLQSHHHTSSTEESSQAEKERPHEQKYTSIQAGSPSSQNSIPKKIKTRTIQALRFTPTHSHLASPKTKPNKMTSRQDPPGTMASGGSSWNDSGYAFAPNTNTLDAQAMPSDQAAAARVKAAEVMAALKSGEPGAADKVMGDNEGKSSGGGITGLGGPKGFFQKLRNKKAEKQNKIAEDGVVR